LRSNQAPYHSARYGGPHGQVADVMPDPFDPFDLRQCEALFVAIPTNNNFCV
jgi:hypothetical protein